MDEIDTLDHRSLTSEEGYEQRCETFIQGLASGVVVFDEIQLSHINRAKNLIKESTALDKLELANVATIWKEVIQKHGFIIPFCQRCGELEELWKFGKNGILCKLCFVVKFRVKPTSTIDVKEVKLHQVLPSLRDVSYSEYKAYAEDAFSELGLEKVMAKQSEYVNWRNLLSSPVVDTIVKSMSTDNQTKIYYLSLFFADIIQAEKDIQITVSVPVHLPA